MLKEKLENWLYKWRIMRCCRIADKQLSKLLKEMKQNELSKD